MSDVTVLDCVDQFKLNSEAPHKVEPVRNEEVYFDATVRGRDYLKQWLDADLDDVAC